MLKFYETGRVSVHPHREQKSIMGNVMLIPARRQVGNNACKKEEEKPKLRASQATSVENIDEKLMALQQELIQKAQSKEAYDEIADEIFRLRELRQKTTVDTAARDEQIKRINDLQD